MLVIAGANCNARAQSVHDDQPADLKRIRFATSGNEDGCPGRL
jgi:hypothetical protein